MAAIQLHRLRIQPRGATLSPWQADTLFGHICWEVLFREGEKGLADFLVPFRAGKPPFVFSDGFPNDAFPRPFLPPPRFVARSKEESEEAMDKAKEGKGIVWLTQAQFEQVLRGERPPLERPVFAEAKRSVLKNQINRLTGTTGSADEDAETGNLYALEELAYYCGEGKTREATVITFYLWAESPAKAEEAKGWLNSLARGGYGRKKSAGYGQFTVESMKPFTLTVPDDANGVVALANFLPAATDPGERFYYKTRVKYGKLGEAAIVKGSALSPFKFPLVMLRNHIAGCRYV